MRRPGTLPLARAERRTGPHTAPDPAHEAVDKDLFACFGRHVVLLLYWALGGLTAIMDGNKSTN
ncbi:hypothetical protein [Micromonospora sp. NPDC005171]|uniref:hypothetical protein n=1 Tax=Micromonospora sp. NPDC005171 TaxID=3156866 RepID=UPI0033A668B2